MSKERCIPFAGCNSFAGCNLGAKSPFSEWQDAYNQHLAYYARMSPDYRDTDPKNYRARDRGAQWAHNMVEASLGAVWHHVYAGTLLEKRNRIWLKLKSNSVSLDDAVEAFGEEQEFLTQERTEEIKEQAEAVDSSSQISATQAEMRF